MLRYRYWLLINRVGPMNLIPQLIRMLIGQLMNTQGMTDRRSRDRRSLFPDREVIADLHFKKLSQGDRDRQI